MSEHGFLRQQSIEMAGRISKKVGQNTFDQVTCKETVLNRYNKCKASFDYWYKQPEPEMTFTWPPPLNMIGKVHEKSKGHVRSRHRLSCISTFSFIACSMLQILCSYYWYPVYTLNVPNWHWNDGFNRWLNMILRQRTKNQILRE